MIPSSKVYTKVTTKEANKEVNSNSTTIIYYFGITYVYGRLYSTGRTRGCLPRLQKFQDSSRRVYAFIRPFNLY